MCGWLNAAAVRASRLNRSTIPSPMSNKAGDSTLIATLRSSARSWPRYTVAMPPCPSSSRISYSPSVARRSASSWAFETLDILSASTVDVASVGAADPVGTGMLVPHRGQKNAPGPRRAPQRVHEGEMGEFGVIGSRSIRHSPGSSHGRTCLRSLLSAARTRPRMTSSDHAGVTAGSAFPRSTSRTFS